MYLYYLCSLKITMMDAINKFDVKCMYVKLLHTQLEIEYSREKETRPHCIVIEIVGR